MRAAEEERTFWDAVDPIADYKECVFEGPAGHGVERIVATLAPVRLAGPWFELGCGTGRLLRPVAWHAPDRVDGFDISARLLAVARNGIPLNAYVTRSDGRTIPAPDESFACGWSVLLFQHLEPEAVRGYLLEAARVLKAGGRFVFQFAYDPDGTDAPYSWNHHPTDLDRWCDSAGLYGRFEHDDLYPTWRWATMEKP